MKSICRLVMLFILGLICCWACAADPPLLPAFLADIKVDTSTNSGVITYADVCPPYAPHVGDNVKCQQDLKCQYASEYCCMTTYFTNCSCHAGGYLQCWGGMDQCLSSSSMCSPGCGMGHFRLDGKCTGCSTIVNGYTTAIAAVLATEATCATDSDCGAVGLSACATPCQLPVQLGREASLTVGVAAVANKYCPGYPSISGCLQNSGCQFGQPRCVKGLCQLRQPCEPGLDPVGSACNDGNACTVGETCTAPWKCTGQAVDCDDNSVCTIDSCSTTHGCVHKAFPAGACAVPGSVCLVSGQCVDGICQSTEFLGQSWDLPALTSQPVALHADANGTAAVAWHQGQQVTAVVRRVNGAGATLWQWSPTSGPLQAAAIAASDDGGAAVVLHTDYYLAGPWAVVRLGPEGQVLWKAAPLPATAAQSGHAVAFVAGDLAVASAVPSGAGAVLTLRRWSKVGTLSAAKEIAGPVSIGRARIASGLAGAIWVATTKDVGTANTDVRLLSVASSGALLVDTTWPEPTRDGVVAMAGLADGGALLAVERIAYTSTSKDFFVDLWHFSPAGKLLTKTATPLFTYDLAGTGNSLRGAGPVDAKFKAFWSGPVVAGVAPSSVQKTPELWPLTGTLVAAIPGQQAFWALGRAGTTMRLLRVGPCP